MLGRVPACMGARFSENQLFIKNLKNRSKNRPKNQWKIDKIVTRGRSKKMFKKGMRKSWQKWAPGLPKWDPGEVRGRSKIVKKLIKIEVRLQGPPRGRKCTKNDTKIDEKSYQKCDENHENYHLLKVLIWLFLLCILSCFYRLRSVAKCVSRSKSVRACLLFLTRS